MNKIKIGSFIAILLLSLGTFAGTARADKSGATLEAPDQAAKGSEIVLRIRVTHSANSFFHHTNWVSVKCNGEEIKKWEYSMNNLPEGAQFTKEVRLVIKEISEVEAESNCNLHGSKGSARKTIAITPSSK